MPSVLRPSGLLPGSSGKAESMQPGVCFALWGFKKIISGLGDSSNYWRFTGELFAACHRPWERVPNGGPAARALGSGDSTQNKATLMVSRARRLREGGAS